MDLRYNDHVDITAIFDGDNRIRARATSCGALAHRLDGRHRPITGESESIVLCPLDQGHARRRSMMMRSVIDDSDETYLKEWRHHG